MRLILLIGAVALVVIGYLLWPTQRTALHQVPFGPYESEGVLTGTGISLVRRGTHIFTASDGTTLFAESSSVNLQDVAGSRVRVTGTVGPNSSDRYLPLLTISAVTIVSPAKSEAPVSSVALGLTLAIPSAWTAHEEKGVLTISVGSSAVLTMRSLNPKQTLPAGTPVRIGGRNGVRQLLTDGSTDITLPLNDRWIVVSIAAVGAALDPTPESVLSTVRFLADAQSSATSSSSLSVILPIGGSGSTSGSAVCGGAAGILCPSGSYCAITDFTQSTGICRPVK